MQCMLCGDELLYYQTLHRDIYIHEIYDSSCKGKSDYRLEFIDSNNAMYRIFIRFDKNLYLLYGHNNNIKYFGKECVSLFKCIRVSDPMVYSHLLSIDKFIPIQSNLDADRIFRKMIRLINF